MTLPIPRAHISMRLQRDVALIMLGLDPATAELDHYPALGLRPINAATGDYDPPQLDPRYLRWRPPAEHKAKTFGKPATSAGADIHLIARAKRIDKAQAFHAIVMADKRNAKQQRASSPWLKRKLRSRGFGK